MNIYSIKNPKIKIASVNRFETISNTRKDICDENDLLQVSTKKLSKFTFVKAHKHLENIRNTFQTQETWITITGSIEAGLFDLDDKLISKVKLMPGDCIIFFNGGHSLEVLEDNTIFYEIKNGPYYGLEKDKISIND